MINLTSSRPLCYTRSRGSGCREGLRCLLSQGNQWRVKVCALIARIDLLNDTKHVKLECKHFDIGYIPFLNFVIYKTVNKEPYLLFPIFLCDFYKLSYCLIFYKQYCCFYNLHSQYCCADLFENV